MLSLTWSQRMRDIVLLQARRIAIAIAPTVGYLVQIVKGTSLAAIIGFTESPAPGRSSIMRRSIR
ncbi:hypothetical protein [Pandoraea pulmonicola]|uniref:Uncharacterized protein n=1 Tax=Pandoraea pulmonicola TaxID=93221 RepID=A0AAJ5CZG6_PANPU|nr:hypothetical protein [Pandoraea pulmonicola]APD13389.1 hypothetical protein RO07_25270 [Pandoraea pulmonicola]SUA89510.1 Uncharacterised protein [Pandoraea pulmonicola]